MPPKDQRATSQTPRSSQRSRTSLQKPRASSMGTTTPPTSLSAANPLLQSAVRELFEAHDYLGPVYLIRHGQVISKVTRDVVMDTNPDPPAAVPNPAMNIACDPAQDSNPTKRSAPEDSEVRPRKSGRLDSPATQPSPNNEEHLFDSMSQYLTFLYPKSGLQDENNRSTTPPYPPTPTTPQQQSVHNSPPTSGSAAQPVLSLEDLAGSPVQGQFAPGNPHTSLASAGDRPHTANPFAEVIDEIQELRIEAMDIFNNMAAQLDEDTEFNTFLDSMLGPI
ncbi:hypothetical protein QCA50_019950 [Cerrena zonata]|uniref:Uncharacterized protein n=1 Tax=Cerrena zonata TaxID=2478898 RepID=A0AAW0FIM2_9APHY